MKLISSRADATRARTLLSRSYSGHKRGSRSSPARLIKGKLTRRDSRDAEAAEDEQHKSLHVSNARTMCGPIYSGRGSCENRRTAVLTGVTFGSYA